MSKVLAVHDGRRERELLLVERLVVGRDPACDISFDDGLLSRRHAEFIAAASAVTVRDLGSRNGVFVNGIRQTEQALRPGDVVQVGPLRVRYVRDHAVAHGEPSPADHDGTRMIAAPFAHAESIPDPPPSSIDVFRPAAPHQALDALDEGEGVTRVDGAATLVQERIDVDDDATGFIPTPPPAPMPLAAASIAAEPPVIAERTAGGPALASFVLIQLGALAMIVFVATVAPLVLSRGSLLGAISEGNVTAILIWPILPLLVGLAATMVIANIVNRRVMDALAARGQNGEGR